MIFFILQKLIPQTPVIESTKKLNKSETSHGTKSDTAKIVCDRIANQSVLSGDMVHLILNMDNFMIFLHSNFFRTYNNRRIRALMNPKKAQSLLIYVAR